MKEWIRSGNPLELKAALTLLNISRWLPGPHKDPDLSPITDAPKAKLEIPISSIQRIINDFQICLNPQ